MPIVHLSLYCVDFGRPLKLVPIFLYIAKCGIERLRSFLYCLDVFSDDTILSVCLSLSFLCNFFFTFLLLLPTKIPDLSSPHSRDRECLIDEDRFLHTGLVTRFA